MIFPFIAQTAIETCKANSYVVSATVVGRNGEIIAQVRGDNTGPHTIENSFRKAYTARTFRAPSSALVDRVKADPRERNVGRTQAVGATNLARQVMWSYTFYRPSFKRLH